MKQDNKVIQKRIWIGVTIFIGVFLLGYGAISPHKSYADDDVYDLDWTNQATGQNKIAGTIDQVTAPSGCGTNLPLCSQELPILNNAILNFNVLNGQYNTYISNNDTAHATTLAPFVNAAYTDLGQIATYWNNSITDCSDYINEGLPCAAAPTPRGVQNLSGPASDITTQTNEAESAVNVATGTFTANADAAGAQSANCPISWNLSVFRCLTYIYSWVAWTILAVCGYLLGLAALLLNGAIRYTVLDMASFVNGAVGINIGWEFIRDIGNMTFIFLLLYAAIKMILGVESSQDKRILVGIVIAGLLVNFSLFFTKAIIDISNILAADFFTLSVGGGATARDFAGQFMSDLGLAGLYSGSNTLTGQTFTNISLIGIGGSIFIMTAILSFAIAALLFVFRFVMLILLLISAPIGYIGYVLPQTKKYASQWWTSLIGNCLFAPLYMILIYLVLVLASNLNNLNHVNGQLASVFANVGGNATSASNLFINYAIIIGFMILATFISMSVASSAGGLTALGAKWGQQKMDKWRKTLAKAPTATVGWAARETVGQAARYADEKAGNTAFGNSRFGRWTRSVTTRAVAESKMGTSKSASQVAKDDKKARENFAKKEQDKIDKKFEKQLPQQRGAAIAEATATVSSKRATLTTLDTEINSLRSRAQDPTLTQAERQSANEDLSRKTQEKGSVEREIDDKNKEIIAARIRINNNSVATEQEQAKLAAMQREEAAKLEKKAKPWKKKTKLEKAGTIAKTVGTVAIGAGIAAATGGVVPAAVVGAGIIIAQVRNRLYGGSGRAMRAGAVKELRDKARGKKARTEQLLNELLEGRGEGGNAGGGGGTGGGAAASAH